MVSPLPPRPVDYDAGTSIVSLAASLAGRFGAGGAVTPVADPVLAHALAGSRGAVLVLMDGVGENVLRTHAPHGALSHHRLRTLSSVFPSSTAPALSTLSAAAPPAAHGNPGWLMWSEAANAVIRTLPMDLRAGHGTRVEAGDTWHWKAWTTRSREPVFALLPAAIADTGFSRHAYAGATLLPYGSLDDTASLVDRLLAAHGDRAHVFVYLPHFDKMAHKAGWAGNRCSTVVQRIDAWFERLVARLRWRDVLVLASADHGFIDVPATGQHRLADHPALASCLERPLTGEPRVPLCSVRPAMQARFAQVLEEALGDAFTVHRAADLLAAGWFGTGDALAGRLGTHVLLPTRRVTLVDALEGEPPTRFIGMHGGPDPDEMQVPLVAALHGKALGAP